MDAETRRLWPGRALWHVPHPFGMAAMLGRGYALRCVLFHDISERTSSFTEGLGVSITPAAFEDALRFLVRHYTPVSLDEALDRAHLRRVRRPVLVTFDDAYASVATRAVPLCRKYHVPSLFFVSARFLDNRDLAIDNLVCHVANTRGLAAVAAAAGEASGGVQDLHSLRQVFAEVLPSLPLARRRVFSDALAHAVHIRPRDAAEEAGLYLTARQLAQLAASGCEVGNHTYSHVHGRTLAPAEFVEEIDWNRSVLESVTARRVRSFSAPYGSSVDVPPALAHHLEVRGYEAVFLVERRMNTAASTRLYRVSVQQSTAADLFSELEVLPRLRALRDGRQHAPVEVR